MLVPVAAADEQHLAGSWKATVTATSPPGLEPFTSLMTYLKTGEVIESRRLLVPFTPFGPLLETTGHGAWIRTQNGQFAVSFVFLLQSATSGAPIGTDNIQLSLTLAPDGETFSGVFRSEVRDVDDNLLFTAEGTVAGTRIRAVPLP